MNAISACRWSLSLTLVVTPEFALAAVPVQAQHDAVPRTRTLPVRQQPAPAQAILRAEPRIEWTDPPQEWPGPVRDSVRFGYLEVPVDHADPRGPTMRIALILVPAGSTEKADDPIVSIAGGPGLPALDLHMRLRAAGPHPLDILRERRDLIVIDARGHGRSDPAKCPELDGAEPLSEQSDSAQRLWVGKLRACRERLLAQGVRLETLSAVQTAHDLELLRRALGAPQLNLIGLSYGTRIAAEAARKIPGAIRAVYYSAPVPPGRFPPPTDAIADEVLATFFDRCRALSDCRKAYPNLRADFDSIIDRLHRVPLRIAIPRSDALPEGELVVDGAMMREGVLQFLLDRERAAGAPLLIHTLANQGFETIRRMAVPLMGSLGEAGVASSTFLAFRCNDGLTPEPPDWLLQRCRALLGDGWREPPVDAIQSDVPGLIVAGELDPRTPPSFARALAAHMPRAHVVIEPWHGHGLPSECTRHMARDFFDRPEIAPDGSCLDSIPPIRFVTHVASSRWTPRLVGWILQNPWRAGVPAAALLLFLVPAIGIPIRETRVARRAHGERAVALTLLGVAVLGLTLLIGLSAAAVAGMRSHFVVPLAGVPAGWGWVLSIPWLLLVLSPIALYLAVNRGSRTHESLPAVLRWSPLLGAGIVLVLWAFTSV